MSTESSPLKTDDILNLAEAENTRSKFRPQSYDEFIQGLYQTINTIIRFIEDSANYQQDSGEDLLTTQMVHQLKWRYNADHDTNTKGHVDIKITSGDYVWLGEAKIAHSQPWIFAGMQQLMTRYSTGRKNATHSGLIIYFFQDKVKTRMINWKNYLEETCKEEEHRDNMGFLRISCEIEDNHQFVSHHSHRISEKEIFVRHFPIMLFHDPKK